VIVKIFIIADIRKRELFGGSLMAKSGGGLFLAGIVCISAAILEAVLSPPSILYASQPDEQLCRKCVNLVLEKNTFSL